jgi:hypothetical protein
MAGVIKPARARSRRRAIGRCEWLGQKPPDWARPGGSPAMAPQSAMDEGAGAW